MKTLIAAAALALTSTAATADWIAVQDVYSFSKPYSRLPTTIIGIYKTESECNVAVYYASWALIRTGFYEKW